MKRAIWYLGWAFLIVLIGTVLDASSSGQSDDSKFIVGTLYPATALLYSQDEDGGMKMRCTATAIEQNATGFVFATAAHCGCEDNVERKTVSPQKTFFYITFDDPGQKTFNKAEVIGCGYRHRGDDFMLLQAKGDSKAIPMPLGNDPAVLDQVANVASPLGLGKQVFTGSVSSSSLDRPLVEDDIDWTGVVLLQMFGVDGGSSGSSVVCLSQKAICAFVVGSVGKTTMTAMPVSRLKKLRSGIADGTYKYWVKDPDSPPVKAETAKK
jgi:hypothetical protein